MCNYWTNCLELLVITTFCWTSTNDWIEVAVSPWFLFRDCVGHDRMFACGLFPQKTQTKHPFIAIVKNSDLKMPSDGWAHEANRWTHQGLLGVGGIRMNAVWRDEMFGYFTKLFFHQLLKNTGYFEEMTPQISEWTSWDPGIFFSENIHESWGPFTQIGQQPVASSHGCPALLKTNTATKSGDW